jgi:CDP-2,3-bis-(O-geranylgeranyl)-sn-glycerol synthase
MFEFLDGLWFILPAYVASSFAVLSGGRIVIDFKKKFMGKRILGDGKTVSGFVGGVFAGAFIGLIQGAVQDFFKFGIINNISMDFYVGFLIAFGAMTGDLAGSFIKRRLGFKRGAPVFLLDQLNLVVGALVLAYLVMPDVIPSPLGIIFILILTPVVHLSANQIAHALKLKKRPW